MTLPADVDRRTRLGVRADAVGFVVATLAMVTWPGLASASNLLVVIIFGGVWLGTALVATAIFERRWPLRLPRRQTRIAQTPWNTVATAAGVVGLAIGVTLFPPQGYRGFYVHDGMVDLPVNTARICILAVGLGFSARLVALMLPTEGRPWLVRVRDWPPAEEDRPPPIDPLDFLLFLLALGVVLVPPAGAMDALTAPFAWPLPQLAAAFLLLQTLLKRQSLVAGLVVYRVVFAVYAVLLVRLALGGAVGLDPIGQLILALALGGVLIVDAWAYVLAARKRAPGLGLGQSQP